MSGGIISATIVGMTDRGLVRANNEDMFLVVEPDTGLILENQYRLIRPLNRYKLLMMVSDGMGGYEGGEVASQLTVDGIRLELAKLPKEISPQSRLEAAVEEANRNVWQQRQENAYLQKMGATVTAVLIEQDTAYIAEVGDSRAYILREGRIKQLTTDQTMVQMLVDSGVLTPEAAAVSRNRNVLLQAVGTQEFLQTAVTAIKLQANDIFLLCSDGLSGKLQANEMNAIVEQSSSLHTAAQALIDAAKERGGDDNITVILAKFEGNGLQAKALAEALTTQIRILSRFDPAQDPQIKPKRESRMATFQDWLSSSIIDSFARFEEQRIALSTLGSFGEYVIFRKGDVLISQSEPACDDHYWLLSGRYRVVMEISPDNKQTVAFLVPPTDQRADKDIYENLPLVRVKRQFFTNTLSTLKKQPHGITIWCEDEINTAIRIPAYLFQRIASILGERYITTVRYS